VKKIAFLVLLLNVMMIPSISLAIIADPKSFLVTQPDGTKVELHIRGDEYYNWLEDTNGYTVLKHKGRYVYALLDKDKKLTPTRYIVGKVSPKALGLTKRLLPSKVEMEKLQRMMLPHSYAEDAVLHVQPSGIIQNLVILCMFSDHTPGIHTRNQADYDILFNAVGGDAILAPTGSVQDFYFENSYGTMTLNSTVVAWVTLPQTEVYYANGQDGTGNTYPRNAQRMVEDALNLVDPLVDFGDFDTDDDGYIDAITIIHSGYGAETGGGGGNWIWSHRWSLWALPAGEWVSGDLNNNNENVKVYDYHTEPALWGSSGNNISRIGVICHEMGHFFGLPDLYDTDDSSEGIGSYGLMANSWGFDFSQLNPPHFCAYSKIFLGWVNPNVINSNGTYTVPQVETNPTIYKIVDGYPSGEYLLVENRQPIGFESIIPQGGLAIWHIDENKSNNNQEGYPDQTGWPANGNHYKVALLQADGDYDLEENRNRGDSGDVYHLDGVSTIGQTTTPNTNAYQDGVIIETGNLISDISVSGATMTFAYYSPQQNHNPFLSNPRVSPNSGAESTAFEFLVDYYDTDGDPPSPYYRRVTISGNGGHDGTMSLKSGLPYNGTYHYTTTLPEGSHAYMFAFADEHGLVNTTAWRSGPYVTASGNSAIEIYISCSYINENLYLKYSLVGPTGPFTPIAITGEELEPLVVPIGTQVWFQAGVNNPNYQYQGWDIWDNGVHDGGASASWWIIPGDDSLMLVVTYNYVPQLYTIDGTVLDADATPVPGGAELTLTSPEQTMVQTTMDGNFSFTGVKGGVTVSVVPSASGYGFSPPSLVFNNLKADKIGQSIIAYSSDGYAPLTSFLTVPSAVSEESSVSFSWVGEDNITAAENLLYQYKLENFDSDWSTWTSDTSKSYELENGVYTFMVRAKDESGNINQTPSNFTFVVNAAPKIIATKRIHRSVWASRITLETPTDANCPNNLFVLLPEHSGISDSELVPVRIYRVNENVPCGASEIISANVNLTERIIKADKGWLVTLPDTIALGQTVQYDIVWGKIKYFGWQEFVEVPSVFPNGDTIRSYYLDEELRLWRMATKVRYKGGSGYNRDSWVFMNLCNELGVIVDETELRYAYGHDWDGLTKEYTSFYGGNIHKIGNKICYFWNDDKNLYDGVDNLTYMRYGASYFDYTGSQISTDDSAYSDEKFYTFSSKPIRNSMWIMGRTGGMSGSNPKNAWFEKSDSEGNITIPETIYYTIQKPYGSWFSHYQAHSIGSDTLLLFSPSWLTADGYEREQIYYQIRDDSGQVIKDTTVLSPPPIPDSEQKDDTYTIQSAITDSSDKVWISYSHWQRITGSEPMYYYYVILDTNGDVWKGPIQTSDLRNFAYCDRDGYIWATESGNLIVLEQNDIQVLPTRPNVYIPSQNIGSISAAVSSDGYRIYDRWSPQFLNVDVPSGSSSRTMELFDLDLWDNGLHCSNINIIKDGNTVWDCNGSFTGNVTVDLGGILKKGHNILTITQDDFLGGQLLVTFPYILSDMGDFTGDAIVNPNDMAIIAEFWLTDEPSVDIAPIGNEDGIVNFKDFAIFADNWWQDHRTPVLIYGSTFDSNPGWKTEGEWAFGQPTGGGGTPNPNPDPNSGYTGINVYGVNLNGNYSTDVGGPYHLTAGPFDCSNYALVKLKFARWLNTDFPPYVQSMLEVSNNGTSWQTVWEHTGGQPITDDDWQIMEYDISSVADNMPAVYVRWSYEIGDEAYPFSGWNIDDVELWGVQ